MLSVLVNTVDPEHPNVSRAETMYKDETAEGDGKKILLICVST